MALKKIESPLPGKVIRVSVKAGDKIAEMGEICVIVAMKMESPIVATVSGIVKEVLVTEGKVVKAGEVLVVIEY